MKACHRVLIASVALTLNFASGSAQEVTDVNIKGTANSDRITVNDAKGVVCASQGVLVEGAVGGATTLRTADPDCPGSSEGHTKYTVNGGGAGNNYYHGDFGDGDDRYTRIDGPGNDKFEYSAGSGDDAITSTDGPGDDIYMYNNGPGADFSVHANNTVGASGNDIYRIDGGPGVDRLGLQGDGPGDDNYTFLNGESIGQDDFFFGDKDVMTFEQLEQAQ